MIFEHSSPAGRVSRCLVGFSMMVAIGCSADGNDPKGGNGSGGSGTGSGGSPGTGGAGTGVSGNTQTFGGAPSGGSQGGAAGTTTTGGSSPSGGTTASGGTPGVAGTTSAAGSGGVDATGCTKAVGDLTTAMLYTGGPAPCGGALDPPRLGTWFAYNDKTGTQMPAPMALVFTGEAGGNGGPTDCAVHTVGTGFLDWGGGIGFDINSVSGKSCPFDASAFSGIKFYAKGTTTGTHGLAYAAVPNTIRVKFRMTDALNAALGGDEHGGWCTLTAEWSQCDIPFATALQEGFGTPGAFSKADLTQIQFQASKAGMSMMPPPTDFNFWIDDVTFY